MPSATQHLRVALRKARMSTFVVPSRPGRVFVSAVAGVRVEEAMFQAFFDTPYPDYWVGRLHSAPEQAIAELRERLGLPNTVAARERNDCTVRAIVAATGKAYEDVHAAMEKCGRVSRKGVNRALWEACLHTLGFKMTERKDLHRPTVRSVEAVLPRGREFLVNQPGHLAGFDGRALRDHTAGSLAKVHTVYEVELLEEGAVVHLPFKDVVVIGDPIHIYAERRGFARIAELFPRPRENREEFVKHQLTWARLEEGVLYYVTIIGDAAVKQRKLTGRRGQVYIVFGKEEKKHG